jgi:hypothetical protein
MNLRTCKDLAVRFCSAKPATDEGDLALAAWRRCVYAVAESAVPMRYAESFKIACERGGIWQVI